ncbi:MAG: hypothetical protein P857_1098 [Candidatus Xenolissoclinum pacificiensis L6]|uniref:Uncharacterized protein n=1 Tax=Candidatus Xenolissoclinum pacificiensis L6 TaxID=1401685 RepID=W2V376_9RICK|nr:MAG: hypothetical protein P857_1098 [Candidatus Xenolissoclinum pacificiensis L6]
MIISKDIFAEVGRLLLFCYTLDCLYIDSLFSNFVVIAIY